MARKKIYKYVMKQTELTHYGYRKSVRRLFSGVLCLIAFTFHLLIVFGQSSPAQAYEVSSADQLVAVKSLCESDLCSLSATNSETWQEHKAHIGLQTCEQDKLSPNVVWIVSPSSTLPNAVHASIILPTAIDQINGSSSIRLVSRGPPSFT
ncbi:hypothetical protein V5T82_04250 [Magnetovibrio sp. PR-2]|uniref:hypothetical protein n=1 Tax=Magnetovibrio sp. PR-2 TaxID=3120356 RepID=UPI002FCE1BC5